MYLWRRSGRPSCDPSPRDEIRSKAIVSADGVSFYAPDKTGLCPCLTLPEWPIKVCNSRPLATSHILSVLSSEAEIASLPMVRPLVKARHSRGADGIGKERLVGRPSAFQRRRERSLPFRGVRSGHNGQGPNGAVSVRALVSYYRHLLEHADRYCEGARRSLSGTSENRTRSRRRTHS